VFKYLPVRFGVIPPVEIILASESDQYRSGIVPGPFQHLGLIVDSQVLSVVPFKNFTGFPEVQPVFFLITDPDIGDKIATHCDRENFWVDGFVK
jgi:hypothetical protein